MKKITFYVLMIFFLASCINKQDDKIVIREYYEDGAIKSETEMNSDSIYNGKQIYYYPSGGRKSVYDWRNDSKDGEVLHFYETGEVEFRGRYVKGNLSGIGMTFYPSGGVKQRAFFESEDTYQFRTYYSNGYPQLVGRKYNGKNTGEFILYSDKDSGFIKEAMHMVCIGKKENNIFGVIYDDNGNISKKSNFNIKVVDNEFVSNKKKISVEGLIFDSTYVVLGYNTCFDKQLYELDTVFINYANKFEYTIPSLYYKSGESYLGGKVYSYKRELADNGDYTYLYEHQVYFYLCMPELPAIPDL